MHLYLYALLFCIFGFSNFFLFFFVGANDICLASNQKNNNNHNNNNNAYNILTLLAFLSLQERAKKITTQIYTKYIMQGVCKYICSIYIYIIYMRAYVGAYAICCSKPSLRCCCRIFFLFFFCDFFCCCCCCCYLINSLCAISFDVLHI